jgi:hypothetical protein
MLTLFTTFSYTNPIRNRGYLALPHYVNQRNDLIRHPEIFFFKNKTIGNRFMIFLHTKSCSTAYHWSWQMTTWFSLSDRNCHLFNRIQQPFLLKHYRCTQWRTLAMNVGGAKRNFMKAEGANSKYFLFYMVRNDKY